MMWQVMTGMALAIGAPADAGPAAPDLLITNVRALAPDDAGGWRVTEGQSVLVTGGRIAATGELAVSMGAEADVTVDGDGATLLPGLSDMHVHVWDEPELPAYLAHGVTMVRNLSGMPYHVGMAKRIEAGELVGPRLLTSGPILNSPGANAQMNHMMVETEAEARRAVGWQAEQGFERIKIYSNLTPEAYAGVRSEAAARGMTITGHSPEGRRADGMPETRDFDIPFDSLLEDEFETLEHVETLAWHGLRNRHDETGARALGQRIAAAGIAVTPTLLAHHNLARAAREGRAFLTREGTQWLNPFVQGIEAEVHEAWLARDPAPVEADQLFYRRMTGWLDEAGVTLVAGSDAGIFSNVPGVSLHEELALMAGGMSAPRVLYSATRAPALVLGEEDRGCLEAGCAADLILVRGDPLEDLGALTALEGVVRAGRYHDRAALDAMLVAAGETDAVRSQAQLMQGLAQQGAALAGD